MCRIVLSTLSVLACQLKERFSLSLTRRCNDWPNHEKTAILLFQNCSLIGGFYLASAGIRMPAPKLFIYSTNLLTTWYSLENVSFIHHKIIHSYTRDYLKIWKQEFSRESSRGLQWENKPPKLKRSIALSMVLRPRFYNGSLLSLSLLYFIFCTGCFKDLKQRLSKSIHYLTNT